MDMVQIVGAGVVAAILSVVIKQYKPEYSMMISLAAGVLIIAVIALNAAPIFEQIGTILSSTDMPSEYIEILLKSLGICYLTQIACDTCKDAGESAIATKIEIAGKIGILMISLPLFQQVLTIVMTLLNT